VNNISVVKTTHDAAVQALKEAGEEVTLTVKHFRPASLFLTRSKSKEFSDTRVRLFCGYDGAGCETKPNDFGRDLIFGLATKGH
jgi:hypothetical protein